MRMHLSIGAPRQSGVRRAGRGLTAIIAAVSLGACGLFDTEINNPNAVVESALSDPAAAKPLVNGLGAAINRSLNQITGTVGAVSDELTWAGSREAWNLLDGGDIADPVNEYTDGQFPYLAEARWLGEYAIKQLEALDKDSKLRDRSDLARAYTYAGLSYILIGENYEDFVISSQPRSGAARAGPRTSPRTAASTAPAASWSGAIRFAWP